MPTLKRVNKKAKQAPPEHADASVKLSFALDPCPPTLLSTLSPLSLPCVHLTPLIIFYHACKSPLLSSNTWQKPGIVTTKTRSRTTWALAQSLASSFSVTLSDKVKHTHSRSRSSHRTGSQARKSRNAQKDPRWCVLISTIPTLLDITGSHKSSQWHCSRQGTRH